MTALNFSKSKSGGVVEINPIFRNFFYTTQKFPSPSGPPREFLHFR